MISRVLAACKRQLSKRWLFKAGVAFVISLPALSALVLLCFELNPRMEVIRESVGRQVVFTDPYTGQERVGTLSSARYRLNDSIGFFDLQIKLSRGTDIFLSMHLNAWELWRVRPVETTEDTE